MGRKRLTYQHVKNVIETEGYGLLSKEYKGNGSKLIIQCPEGHKYTVTFNAFQQGCRCPICDVNRKLHPNQRSK